MKKVSSKILAILLSLTVIFSMMPGMAFAEDGTSTAVSFKASVNGTEMTNVVKTDDSYTTTMSEYVGKDAEGADDWGYVNNTVTVDTYTVTIPKGTESVDLEFSEPSLAYNYTKAGTYLSGSYDDPSTGTKKVTVPVDSTTSQLGSSEVIPADGEIDYIWVQTPYSNNNSTLLYAITFEYAQPTTVTVDFTSQAYNAFIHAPQFGVEVKSDLAESYGFKDDLAQGVSALDVLIKAHEIAFGEDFTKETMAEYIEGSSSYISTAFGARAGLSFAVNGKCPNDGVWNEQYGGYTGYAINQAEIKDGDFVEFFGYQDDYYGDYYCNLSTEDKTIYPGQKLNVNLEGYSFMYYGFSTPETIKGATEGIEDAQIAIVDVTTGNITDIEGAVTDEDGNASISFAKAGTYYITAYMPEEEIEENYATPVIMPLKKVTVAQPNVCFTVPEGAKLEVAAKPSGKHYVAFTPQDVVSTVTNADGTKTYYYNLKANSDFNFRISGEEYITYSGKFKSPAAGKAAYEKVITEDMLKPEGKTAKDIDRNAASNNGYNMADIYLNINDANFLELNKDDTFQIVNLRNWEATDTVTTNYFIEPDYSYQVIDFNGNASDVVSVSETGKVTAEKEGAAVVLVTYDAFNYESGVGGPFYGAIWPENTGVFVVTVGNDENCISANMTINEGLNPEDVTAGKLSGDKLDAEHDVIYYLTSLTQADGTVDNIANAHGEYTFKPTTTADETLSVEVANPVVGDTLTYNGFKNVREDRDGAYTVSLTEGRNIVKISGKTSGTVYQVITAKGVAATVNNITNPGLALSAGDAYSVSFDKIYHPANKLAGVYNMSAGIIYADVTGYEGKTVGGSAAQYNFASTAAAQTVTNVVTWGPAGFTYSATKGEALKVPAEFTGNEITLSNGYIIAAGFGDPYGNHRGISYETGKAPNLNAATKVGYLGSLPTVTAKVAKADSSKKLDNIEVLSNAKDTYYPGDTFDLDAIVLKANYTDGTSRNIAGGFTADVTYITEDTTVVNLTYGDKVIEVPVTVKPLYLYQLKVGTQPSKKTYTEGEYFDPSGMVINAVYANTDVAAQQRLSKNQITRIITDYTYTNTPLTVEDTKVVVSYEYNGTTKTVNVPVTVNAKESSAATDEITVNFTLLGDSKHGAIEKGHTLKGNDLTTWVAKSSITVDKDSNVLAVITKALAMNGMGFKNASGNYISEINGLGEFDNGPLSGWMYTLNGRLPSLGVAEQKVSNGDTIVFFYTDDYTVDSPYDTPAGGTDTDSKIEAGAGGKVSYDEATGVVTITPDEGYEVEDVIVNGTSMGAVTKLEGIKKTDVVTVTFKAMEFNPESADMDKIIAGVKATTIKLTTKKTSKGIKSTWTKSKGYKVDKYQVYRSTSGKKGTFKKVYATKKSTTKSYTNKKLKKGKTYYYKVRGVRKIDGKNYYTKWSKVSKRTFK